MALRRKYFFLRGGPVVSDEGFSVRFKDRTQIVYEDEIGTVIVSGEQMAIISEWVLYARRMHVASPQGPLLKDEDRRNLVIDRVKSVAKFLHMTLEIESEAP